MAGPRPNPRLMPGLVPGIQWEVPLAPQVHIVLDHRGKPGGEPERDVLQTR